MLFFFKQKTAYEVRISDWSSDVCSSDLVLLLEDITSWEGIDDSLIDVLVTNAGTRDDMCPLISVVGVTPAYYQKLHGNYRGRITHELSLGEARDEGDLQDVATMRSRSSRLSFAARERKRVV